MGLVYANGTLNKGASHASSPDQGCFSQRPSSSGPHAIIDYAPEQSGRIVRLKITRGILFTESPFNPSLEPEPQERRAWCVQKIILCRRMLWFGAQEIR